MFFLANEGKEEREKHTELQNLDFAQQSKMQGGISSLQGQPAVLTLNSSTLTSAQPTPPRLESSSGCNSSGGAARDLGTAPRIITSP